MQVHQNVAGCRNGENVSNRNTCFETDLRFYNIGDIYPFFDLKVFQCSHTRALYLHLFIFVETILLPYNCHLPMAVTMIEFTNALCHVGCQREGQNICQSLKPWQMPTAVGEAPHIESYDTRQEWSTVSCMQKFHKVTNDYSLSHLSPLQHKHKRGWMIGTETRWYTCMWVEDTVLIEMHIKDILALWDFYRWAGDRAEVDIYICHRPWVNDSPLLVSYGWAVAGGSLRWTVGTWSVTAYIGLWTKAICELFHKYNWKKHGCQWW